MYIIPMILGETQMSFKNCTIITLTKCLTEAILSFLDTPFLYIDKVLNKKIDNQD